MKTLLTLLLSISLLTTLILSTSVQGQSSSVVNNSALFDLRNFQQNNAFMFSSGLPNKHHFNHFKSVGVKTVVDLIPGDRSKESTLVESIGLDYHNIPVIWDSPKLSDFQQYVQVMKQSKQHQSKVLTHCKLNWRGAAFTYLYRVTQLNESKDLAKKDLLAIWQPNETWQSFMDQVEQHYK